MKEQWSWPKRLAAKGAECSHTVVRKVKLGTTQDGPIYGLQCQDCKGVYA